MEGKTIYTKTVSKRNASSVDFPKELNPQLKEYLINMGINSLYSHQADMFESAAGGKSVVITTSTASGKTLGFLLPVVQEILKDPLTRNR